MKRRGKPLIALSLGGGVQSSALTVLALQGRLPEEYLPLDVIYFLDLKAEPPETYQRIAQLEQLAWNKVPFHIIDVPDIYQTALAELDKGRIFIPLYNAEGMPSIRACTSQCKIAPARKFQRDYMYSEGRFWVKSLIGISYDEVRRMKEAEVEYVEHCYPLVDLKLTRDDCKEILIEAGINPVAKSACFFCPFASPFRGIHPDFEEKIARLEEKANKLGRTFYPKRIIEGGNCDGWCEL